MDRREEKTTPETAFEPLLVGSSTGYNLDVEMLPELTDYLMRSESSLLHHLSSHCRCCRCDHVNDDGNAEEEDHRLLSHEDDNNSFVSEFMDERDFQHIMKELDSDFNVHTRDLESYFLSPPETLEDSQVLLSDTQDSGLGSFLQDVDFSMESSNRYRETPTKTPAISEGTLEEDSGKVNPEDGPLPTPDLVIPVRRSLRKRKRPFHLGQLFT